MVNVNRIAIAVDGADGGSGNRIGRVIEKDAVLTEHNTYGVEIVGHASDGKCISICRSELRVLIYVPIIPELKKHAMAMAGWL